MASTMCSRILTTARGSELICRTIGRSKGRSHIPAAAAWGDCRARASVGIARSWSIPAAGRRQIDLPRCRRRDVLRDGLAERQARRRLAVWLCVVARRSDALCETGRRQMNSRSGSTIRRTPRAGIRAREFIAMSGWSKPQPVHVGAWGTYVTTPEVSQSAATVNLKVTVDNDSKRARTSVSRRRFSRWMRTDKKPAQAVAKIAPANLQISPGGKSVADGVGNSCESETLGTAADAKAESLRGGHDGFARWQGGRQLRNAVSAFAR